MRFGKLIVAAALAFGLAGAASAAPLPSPAEMIQPDTVTGFTKRGHKGWKGHRGRHYGWYRGRHRGWARHHRRVYYAPPRRHYGHYRGRHYGHYRGRHYGHYRGRHYGWGYRRPARAVYFRF